MKLEEFKKPHKFKIYLDADGVLANFDKHANDILQKYAGPEFHYKMKEYAKNGADPAARKRFWDSVKQYQDGGGKLWEELEVLPDAHELVKFVKPYPTEVLTATGPPEFKSKEQKTAWFHKHFGKMKINTVRRSKDKGEFAKPNHILIDDMEISCKAFRDAGGIAILHTSAKKSITELKRVIKSLETDS